LGDRLACPNATNADFFAAAGVTAIVFGPGDIEQAHTADEWMSLDQVRLAAEILHRFSSAQ
jgi:acetylornithine deacetylase